MKNIDLVISELKSIETIKNLKTFKKELKTILDKYQFTHLSEGAYTKVYKSPKFSYVIKVTIVSRTKFDTNYNKAYLKPIYVSANRFLAIQNIAETTQSLNDKISSEQKLLEKQKTDEIKQITQKYKALEEKRIKPLTTKLENMNSNLGAKFNYREFPDVHSGNVGYYRNKIYLIDLDNHAKKPA